MEEEDRAGQGLAMDCGAILEEEERVDTALRHTKLQDFAIVRPRCVRSKRKQSPSLMSLHLDRSLVKHTSACFIRLQ